MLWLALKPIQHRHIVVSFVITGAVCLMLICSAGSRGVSFGPQNVWTRWTTPSVKIMLALRTMRILAAKMLFLFCGLNAQGLFQNLILRYVCRTTNNQHTPTNRLTDTEGTQRTPRGSPSATFDPLNLQSPRSSKGERGALALESEARPRLHPRQQSPSCCQILKQGLCANASYVAKLPTTRFLTRAVRGVTSE